MVALVAICAGCGGTSADTPVNADNHHRRVDPALARARAAATQAEMNLSWARTAIATRWLLQPEGQRAFADFTGQVALDAVCHSLLEGMPAVDRERVHHLEKQESLRLPPHAVRNGTTSALVKAGHRWASHRIADRPHADLAEWWAWAHDVHQAVRRTIRDLAHDGSHHPAPLHSLVHGSSWVATRAFVEYTRLCTRPTR